MGLAVTGIVGFLLVRSEFYAERDPARTLANPIERESLARMGIALELGIATCQALAAIGLLLWTGLRHPKSSY